MNENMEFPDMSGEDIEWLQDSFVKVIFGRIEESLANRRMKKEDAGKVSSKLSPSKNQLNCCPIVVQDPHHVFVDPSLK